jgi:hypothetical protein
MEIRIVSKILSLRKLILSLRINQKAREVRKILVMNVNASNVVSGEAILLRSAPLENRRGNLNRLIWRRLQTLDIQEKVQKNSRTWYSEDSDNEDDCLYLHEENRIKAMDFSGKDYAFYANYSRSAQQPDFREGFDQDIGRVRDTGSDSDSVASCHVSAYFAAGRGKVRDDSYDDNDDDNSVVTDHTSDQESTVQYDQSRPRRAARDASNLTTYRKDHDSSSEDTKSPPSNVLSGGYKFNVGSTVNIFC